MQASIRIRLLKLPGRNSGSRLDAHAFWMMSMQAGYKAAYDCVKAFSETDLTEDLKSFDIPTLIIHGDDDQIVPFADSAALSSRLVPGAELNVYPGAPHGLMATHRDKFHADLLEFVKR